MICKIFYISNQLQICPFIAEGTNLDPWIMFFKTIVDRSLPDDVESFTE
jgi:hypothetical protein